MTTDTIGSPSPDAAPIAIPGWRMRPMSDTPIHRESESCDRVGVVTPGPPCVELVLPAGLVRELARMLDQVALGNGHSDIPDDEARAIRKALRRLERLEGK